MKKLIIIFISFICLLACKDVNHPIQMSKGGTLLLGFAKDKNGDYLIGTSIHNALGQSGVARFTKFDSKGKLLDEQDVFGMGDHTTVNVDKEPASAGSSRMIYNPDQDEWGLYCSHKRLSSDNVSHQAGWFSFHQNSKGFPKSKTPSKSWYSSHNFDQRIIYKEGFYYLLSHGDAYPRKLVCFKLSDKGESGFSKELLTIPGNTGVNTTYSNIGDITILPDNNIATVISSKFVTGITDFGTTEPYRVRLDIFKDATSPSNGKVLSDNSENCGLSKIATTPKGIVVAYLTQSMKTVFVLLSNSGVEINRVTVDGAKIFYTNSLMVNPSNPNQVKWITPFGGSLQVHSINVENIITSSAVEDWQYSMKEVTLPNKCATFNVGVTATYGSRPLIDYIINPNGSFDVAWINAEQKYILEDVNATYWMMMVSKIDANGNLGETITAPCGSILN